MTHIDTSKEAVERLLDGVTPGPWYSEKEDPNDGPEDVVTAGDYYVASLHYLRGMDEPAANARFIAAARELVPALATERNAQAARADAAEAREKALLSTYDAERKALVENVALRHDIARLTFALAETEALEEQHGAVVARLTAELTALRSGQDALVAAACMSMRDRCADMVEREGHGLHVAIRHAPIPSDATAALDAVLRAERNKVRRDVAKLYENGGGPGLGGWDYFGDFYDAILAMIEPEGK